MRMPCRPCEDTALWAKILTVNGDDVTDRVPSETRLSMVFQCPRAYPHMTVQGKCRDSA